MKQKLKNKQPSREEKILGLWHLMNLLQSQVAHQTEFHLDDYDSPNALLLNSLEMTLDYVYEAPKKKAKSK